jgi:hypothetical protein
MTFIVAIHEVEDADTFWGAARPWAALPDGIRLHCVFPLVNGAKAVCLWEGESADSVGDFVDEAVGESSRNEFYEVDRLTAVGLPDVPVN